MKTFILQNLEQTIRVEIKADVFCKNSEFLEPGFETRFTNMEVVDSEVAVIAGIDLKQIENSFRKLFQLAEQLNLSLTVVDINHPASSIELREVGEILTVESEPSGTVPVDTELTFTASSNIEGDVTGDTTFSVNGAPIPGSTYTPDSEGELLVVGVYGGLESIPVVIEVIIPIPESVVITPSTLGAEITGTPETVEFSAEVLPEGSDQNVTWSIDGDVLDGLTVVDGTVAIEPTAVPGVYTVSAVSVVDTELVGTATLTLTTE